MNEKDKLEMAAYVAEYIAEELARGNADIDKWAVLDAINAYLGGASHA